MPGTGGCRGEVPRKSQTAPPGENPECWEPRMRTGLAEGRQYLATHPLCVKCMAVGRYTKATVVDHIEGNYDLTSKETLINSAVAIHIDSHILYNRSIRNTGCTL